MTTTQLLVRDHSTVLSDYISTRLLNTGESEHHFLPQQRCYAAKKGFHLRRTVKLDPVAEFFLYDIVFRHRHTFRADHQDTRRTFGYRFHSGTPTQASAAYGSFKAAIRDARTQYRYTLSVDVATYFNSVYQHDLVNCVRGLQWLDHDTEAFGQFLRETNVGRSVDCLPQGIHPCKVLGSEFLRFIDNDHALQSEMTLRFMDDIHLFSDHIDSLTTDILTIQKLLGEKGLSLNDAKTFEGPTRGQDIAAEVDAIKTELLQMRRLVLTGEYGDGSYGDGEHTGAAPLDEEQVEYLLNLIKSPDVEESDAELVLALLRDHGDAVLPRMVNVLRRFPGLTKNLYNFARFAPDTQGLDTSLLEFLQDAPVATEYQLFWIAKLAEEFLSNSPYYGSILIAALDHPNSTILSRAKVLEIPDRRFGLTQRREERLRMGRSDWESWASALGTRLEAPASRNHLLGYFANGSPLNRIISRCVQAM